MGLRFVTLATRGKAREALLADLGLVATGAQCRFYEEADVSGVQLGDWYVVAVANRSAFRERIDEVLLARAASGAELVVCGIDEGSMVMFAVGFGGGAEAWSVVHDLNLGDRHLAIAGDLPKALADIVNRQTKAQDDEDDDVDLISEIPIELCEDLTGFHPLSAADDLLHDMLAPIGPQKPPSEDASRCMEIDRRPAVHWPLACQVMATIDAMTPRGGPGFLILKGPNEDYMQTAGGDGPYLAEWREHESGAFRHRVAGRHGAVPPGTVEIPTDAESGTYVVAHQNEVLSAGEVKVLARAFLNGEPPPDVFAWRDITAMFG